MVAPVPCALAIATSVSKQTNTCARRFAITISSVLYLTSLTGALHKNKKEAKILYHDDMRELETLLGLVLAATILAALARRSAAYPRERLDYFVGRHAGYSLSRCGNGAPAGLSVSRPDRAHGVLRRRRHAVDSGLTLKPPLRARSICTTMILSAAN